ncbi:MAG: DUF7260 family protein [Halobacteriota archaeon]|uniref:DUF7260 family protein n=1 Tax=Natronomonas sp. TaxID=2184060 RepID=UPI003975AEBA
MSDLRTIDRALERIERERESIERERGAFDRFETRLRPLPIASRTAGGERVDPTTVVETYDDTVMATVARERAYDETLEEHLSNELGEVLAKRLEKTEALTGRLKRDLLSAAEEARNRREGLLVVLDGERSSIETARRDLRRIHERLVETPGCSTHEQPIDRVIDGWRALDGLEANCGSIATERQRYLFEERPSKPFDDPLLFDAYLYRDLETTHPVLSAVAATIEAIGSKRITGIDRDEQDIPV